MIFQNIIEEIEKADPEFQERVSPRRAIIKNFGFYGKRIALSALPFALGGLFKKAYGQTTNTVVDVLKFAFTLENLEAEFYKKGASTMGLIPSGTPAVGAINIIRDDEVNHVRLLSDTIKALSGSAPAPMSFSDFDYTAKGNFNSVFSNYDTFLAVGQAFEDTGVRAYKGQAPNLMGTANRGVLTAALNIHSVEARHASHIRQMRKARNSAINNKPWITGNDNGGLPAATQAVYNGEEMQAAGLTGMTFGGVTLSANAVTESFDEPLTKDQVLTIVTPFLA